ncbi:hypothetical protein FHS16_004965 [Paenibacillus endophyticus]|uniref:TadE-like domain-containing protein n=1 Tax=Paenibacillus endophyticus TaxID=1294268 RepID=A0A7W5GCY2_9BACL|nr:TadE/TadG family type IV pilus assembly protein [Paenibacillus endophyticus]MBB3154883.1 hypothetical protein [Paenibacillus endophyticus]
MGKQRYRERLLQGLRREQGSFTLEATIVFPMLLGLILLFILFGMYMYQKVVLYYAASSTAERAAFSWDNSFRMARSGMLSEPVYDGLYWRIGDDEMLSSLFSIGSVGSPASVGLPVEGKADTVNGDLYDRKLVKSAQWMGEASLTYEGQMIYSRAVLKRMVEVKLKSPFSNGRAASSWWRREPKTVASASITDPVEFIRSIDLTRYYSARFANRAGGAGQAKQQAGKVLAPYAEASNAGKPKGT